MSECLCVCLSVCVSVYMYVCLTICSYTLVFLYYAFSLVCLLLCRPIISAKLIQHGGTKSIYAALYFLPILICSHAVLAGFICTYLYKFTYLFLATVKFSSSFLLCFDTFWYLACNYRSNNSLLLTALVRKDNIITSVRLFVHLTVLTLMFEPTDLWPWMFACDWVMTVACKDWRSGP